MERERRRLPRSLVWTLAESQVEIIETEVEPQVALRRGSEARASSGDAREKDVTAVEAKEAASTDGESEQVGSIRDCAGLPRIPTLQCVGVLHQQIWTVGLL